MATYYVSATGNNNNSGLTEQLAFTFQKAAITVQPGDTVIAKSGTYAATTENYCEFNITGTAGSPITIRSEIKGGAVIDGVNNTGSYGFVFGPGVSYYNIEGFEMTGFRYGAFWANNRVNPNSYLNFRHNHVHHIGRFSTPNGASPAGSGGYYNGTHHCLWEFNLWHDIGRFDPTESGDAAGYENHDHAYYLSGVHHITIRYDVFYNCNRGYGVHVYSSNSYPNWDIFIYNNTFDYGNPYRSGSHIALAATIDNCQIYNNIFGGHGQGLDTAIRNDPDFGEQTNTVAAYNIVHGGAGSGGLATFDTLIANFSNIYADPMYSDPAARNFTLLTGSPAINAGTNINFAQDHAGTPTVDYLGNAVESPPDMGAYQFGGVPPGPTPGTYYVATTGSDSNNGSQGAPWLTLQHAADTVVAGSTVIVMDGTYSAEQGTRTKTLTAISQSYVLTGRSANLIKGGEGIYYVAKNGSDSNDGSFLSPFLTIAHGVGVLNAGDTLYIREGVYNEDVYIDRTGTSASRITISSYPGETAVIDGNNFAIPSGGPLYETYGFIVTLMGSYVTIKDIEIRYSRGGGLYTGGQYNVADGIYTHHNMQHGILCQGIHGVVQNCEVWYNCMNWENEVALGPYWGVGITVMRNSATDWLIKNNTVHGNWGEGISAVEVSNITFQDNISYDNFRPNLYACDVSNIVFERNFAYATHGWNTVGTIGISLGDEQWHTVNSDIRIVNNIVSGCDNSFLFWSQLTQTFTNVLIANNTFVNGRFTLYNYDWILTNLEVRNNIFYNQDSEIPTFWGGLHAESTYVFSNNCWSALPSNAQAIGTGDVTGNPSFANLASPYLTESYRVLEGSICIGAGVATGVDTDYANGQRTITPTIGAFEYSAEQTGPIYYVAKNGSDSNDGSLSSPFLTVAHGVSALIAGYTLYICEGVYMEKVWIGNAGTSDSPITIKAYPGDNVVIDGNNYSLPSGTRWANWGSLLEVEGSYLNISDIEIRNSMGYGIFLSGDHITLTNINSHHNEQGGAVVQGSYNIVQDSSFVSNCLNHANGVFSDPNNPWWATGISVCRDNANNAIIRRCISHDNWGEGISVFEGNTHHVVIEDCISYNNYNMNFYINDASDVIFQRNFAYFNQTVPGAMVNFSFGDEVAGNGGLSNVSLINNIAYGGNYAFNWWNIAASEAHNNILIAHNTFVDSGLAFNPGTSSMTNVRIQNNIFFNSDTGEPMCTFDQSGTILWSNNCWSRAPIAPVQGAGDVTGDPGFANIGSPYIVISYKVTAGSLCINAGANVGIATDYETNQRTAPTTIGAFEYQVSGPGTGSGIAQIIDSYAETNYSNSTSLHSTNNTAVGQVFTAGANAQLSSAKFLMSKTNSPTGSGYMKLYAITGTPGDDAVPTGSALAVSDAIDVSAISNTYALVEGTFSGVNQYSLTEGSSYAITFEYSGGNSTDRISFRYDDTSPTHAGNIIFRNSLNEWSAGGGQIQVTNQLIDSYSETNRDGIVFVNSDGTGAYRKAAYQAFPVATACTLTSAKFWVRKTGTPTGTAYVRLYAHTGTYGTSSIPTGSPLATATTTLDVSTLSNDVAGWELKEFLFAGYSLQASTYYCIAIEFSGGGADANALLVGVDNSAAGSGKGNYGVYKLSDWYEGSGTLCFYVYADVQTGTGEEDAPFYVYGLVGVPVVAPAENVLSITRGGSGGNYITFRSQNKYGAVIDGGGTIGNGIRIGGGASYIKIQDFEIKNFASMGVFCNDAITESSYVTIQGCKIHDIARRESTPEEDVAEAEFCGIYLRRKNHHWTIVQNLIYNIGRTNNTAGYFLEKDHAIFMGDDEGVPSDRCHDNKIVYNIVFFCSGPAIQTCSTGDLIANNVIAWSNQNDYKDGCPFIYVFDSTANLTVANNIFLVRGSDYPYVFGPQFGCAGFSVKNNLIWGGRMWASVGSGETAAMDGGNHGLTDCELAHVDPMLVSADPATAPDGIDFHPQGGSPVIGAGADVGLTEDYLKSGIIGNPDIGVFELQSVAENWTLTATTQSYILTGNVINQVLHRDIELPARGPLHHYIIVEQEGGGAQDWSSLTGKPFSSVSANNFLVTSNVLFPRHMVYNPATQRLETDCGLHVSGQITATEEIIAWVAGAVGSQVLANLTATAPLRKSTDSNIVLDFFADHFEINGSNQLQIKAGIMGGTPGAHDHSSDVWFTTALSTKQGILSGTGFIKISGTTISYDNSTYLTAITKAMVEAVLTGEISSHTHAYLTTITKAMVEAVLTGEISTHTHALGWGSVTGKPFSSVSGDNFAITGEVLFPKHLVYNPATQRLEADCGLHVSGPITSTEEITAWSEGSGTGSGTGNGGTITTEDGIFDLDVTGSVLKVAPYQAKKVSDPGYPYFYTGNQDPEFTRLLNLDGILNAFILQTKHGNLLSALTWNDGIYTQNNMSGQLWKTAMDHFGIVQYQRDATNTYASFFELKRSFEEPTLVIFSCYRLHIPTQVKTFMPLEISAGSIRLTEGTANRILGLDANKNLVYLEGTTLGGDITKAAVEAVLTGEISSHSHAYLPTSSKGAAGGVAELDAGGKLPSAQLPLGETSSTAYRGDRGKTAFDYSQVGHLPLAGGDLTGPLTGTTAAFSGEVSSRNSFELKNVTGETKWIISLGANDVLEFKNASGVLEAVLDQSGNIRAKGEVTAYASI